MAETSTDATNGSGATERNDLTPSARYLDGLSDEIGLGELPPLPYLGEGVDHGALAAAIRDEVATLLETAPLRNSRLLARWVRRLRRRDRDLAASVAPLMIEEVALGYLREAVQGVVGGDAERNGEAVGDSLTDLDINTEDWTWSVEADAGRYVLRPPRDRWDFWREARGQMPIFATVRFGETWARAVGTIDEALGDVQGRLDGAHRESGLARFRSRIIESVLREYDLLGFVGPRRGTVQIEPPDENRLGESRLAVELAVARVMKAEQIPMTKAYERVKADLPESAPELAYTSVRALQQAFLRKQVKVSDLKSKGEEAVYWRRD